MKRLRTILAEEGLLSKTADTSGGKYLVRNIENATNLKFIGAEDTGGPDGEFGGEGAVYRFENEAAQLLGGKNADAVEVYYEAAFDEHEEIDQGSEIWAVEVSGRLKEFDSEKGLIRFLKRALL